MNKDYFENSLKNAGFKLTRARLAIIEAILKFQDKPFSAETIYTHICRSKNLKCDQASVYRTLSVLEEIKVLKQSDIFGETKFFEVTEDGHSHKHHITCKKCHKIDVIDFCLVESQEKLLSKIGYKNLSHRLELVGICPKCA